MYVADGAIYSVANMTRLNSPGSPGLAGCQAPRSRRKAALRRTDVAWQQSADGTTAGGVRHCPYLKGRSAGSSCGQRRAEARRVRRYSAPWTRRKPTWDTAVLASEPPGDLPAKPMPGRPGARAQGTALLVGGAGPGGEPSHAMRPRGRPRKEAAPALPSGTSRRR